MEIDNFQVNAPWVVKYDDSWRYQDYCETTTSFFLNCSGDKVSKLSGEAVCTLKYCLQIAKCDDFDSYSPLRTNIQRVLKGRFLPTSLAFGKGATLLDQKKKDEKNKASWIL